MAALARGPGFGLNRTYLIGDHRMKRLLVLATIVLAASPGLAHAAQGVTLNARTAGELADLCVANPKEPAADAKINYCLGFAQGAIDVELRRAGEKKPFCFPSPPPRRMATMTEFTGWVRSMPDHKSLGVLDGLFQFMAQRFPCK
jgi:Rap1a immunity proteins